ncbi:hypothetical protein DL89DRAFT_264988 [Linderina pennispora]|uniref:Uncharacterized protein n=1 Tax=Linderina pennispora TaxID=61395 RepID=A0A1Y1WGV6_9FUNG|nr:uncharacterized protein DL89DRAFT_264988 [Linderina pennispora]ORX72791.1 hypothetical protein DL89DRAFT_264988 [Linderina pennispora]
MWMARVHSIHLSHILIHTSFLKVTPPALIIWAVAVTETYAPYAQIACSGAYQADYSDSVTQYTKTVEYASQYPGGLFRAPFTAFEDNQPPAWYPWYSPGYYSDRSSSDYDISKPTPTGYGPTSSAPVTPTPPVNEKHFEFR